MMPETDLRLEDYFLKEDFPGHNSQVRYFTIHGAGEKVLDRDYRLVDNPVPANVQRNDNDSDSSSDSDHSLHDLDEFLTSQTQPHSPTNRGQQRGRGGRPRGRPRGSRSRSPNAGRRGRGGRGQGRGRG